MKSAIYLDEADTQLVLTASNEWEKNILRMLNASMPDKTYWGEFYACQGGWIRQSSYSFSGERKENNSLIFRIAKPTQIPEHQS